MSDEDDTKDTPKDPLILRCLKAAARIDWKAMAIVAAALAGLGGAIWNRIDSVIDRAMSDRTQQGVYEVLAEKLDGVAARLAAIELAHGLDAPKKIQKSESGRAPIAVPSTAAAMALPDSVQPAPLVADKLPSFKEVQQIAAQNSTPTPLTN